MCGIAGFVGEGGPATLEAMCEAIAHRGPDGRGTYIDPRTAVHLGHQRLSVLDISGGSQPMWNETGSVGVIFNGEIYNHRPLRAELESKGHRFASDHSDTEVLVHGWEEWGSDLPRRLNGMFAFAVYDSARERLFLARDRFGEKPLFYSHSRGLFAFASELAGLLAHTGVERDLDYAALRKYFAHCFFPAPHTPYRAIRKLPAGHSMQLDLRSGELRVDEYWRFDVEPDESLHDEARLAEELRGLVQKAVKGRLESDVPLGILLSGGIDSSVILRCAEGRIKTFSAGFAEASYDESSHARRMAEFCGSEHYEERCDLAQAKTGLSALLRKIGEPIGDPSILPTHLVCAFARKHVTVALSGDGGDELFAGYDPFKALGPSALYKAVVPRAIHPAFEALAARLPMSDANMSLDFKIRRWLRGMRYDAALWSPVWMAALAPDEISELFATPSPAEDLYSEVLVSWERCASKDIVDRTLVYFTRFYLQDDILVKTDRASMQPALELRAPFLDNEVADFARRLPHHFKMRGGVRKYLLKKAFGDLLPPEIIARPKKGFGIPLASWLREMPVPDTTAATRAGLQRDVLARRWTRHQARAEDNRHALWCHLSLEHGIR